MDTLITRYPLAFSSTTGLPTLVPAIASAGVDTYSDRWLPSRTSLAHGASVDALANQVAGRLALTQGVTASRPLMQRSGDEAWIKFDGVDDFIRAALSLPQPYSVFMVARTRSTAAKTLFRGSTAAPTVQFVSDPGPLTKKFSVRATSTIGNTSGSNPADGAWHVLGGVYNGASSISLMDSEIVTGDVGAGPLTTVSLGDTGVGVGNTDYDLAEILVWSTALSTAQCQSVYSAMRTNHPTLLA